jgi:hypothetical protein
MLSLVNYPATTSHASAHYVQLLEIAVSNVVTAPIRHSIELQAMRELHVGFLEKPL